MSLFDKFLGRNKSLDLYLLEDFDTKLKHPPETSEMQYTPKNSYITKDIDTKNYGNTKGMESENKKNPLETVPLTPKKSKEWIHPDESSQDSRVKEVRIKVNEVMDVLRENIDLAIQRGEDLDDIERKTEKLRDDSLKFQNGSRSLRQRYCRQNYICYGIIAILLFICIILLIVYSSKK